MNRRKKKCSKIKSSIDCEFRAKLRLRGEIKMLHLRRRMKLYSESRQQANKWSNEAWNKDRLVVKIKIAAIVYKFTKKKMWNSRNIWPIDDGVENRKSVLFAVNMCKWRISMLWLCFCCCWLCFYFAHPDKMRWTTWSKNADTYRQTTWM